MIFFSYYFITRGAWYNGMPSSPDAGDAMLCNEPIPILNARHARNLGDSWHATGAFA
ncbi:MAG: hypothetical protein Q6373_013840 [Candidatus Sigynarchaeota archaeon]